MLGRVFCPHLARLGDFPVLLVHGAPLTDCISPHPETEPREGTCEEANSNMELIHTDFA
jgi:hypothetical protein